MLYSASPNLIIGFHGCDEGTRNKLLTNPYEIKISKEKYDWLGHGMYFWENNYERALQWAKDKQKRNTQGNVIKKPAVIGAVLQLNYCCDFLDSEYINALKAYYKLMVAFHEKGEQPIPQNKNVKSDKYGDKLLRELDCAVIEFMHSEVEKNAKKEIESKGYTDYKIFDSVRGLFPEGGPAYNGAGLLEKTHIQICIRNPNCIKGFFLPRNEINFLKHLKVVN